MLLKLRLPDPPPSVNRAWKMWRGHMVRSSEFRAWEKAALDVLEKHPERLPDLCYWRTEIFVPKSKTGCDLDNLPKAIHDAIVRAKLTPDDRYLVKFTISFWAGEHLLIYVHKEGLDVWQRIMKPSKAILKRMLRALNLTLPV